MHEKTTTFIFIRDISTGKEPGIGEASKCMEQEGNQMMANQIWLRQILPRTF